MQAKGGKGGGQKNKELWQRQARDTGRRYENQRLAGAEVDAIQVDGVTLRERRWGEGETEGCYNKNWLLMRDSRIEGE